MDYTNLHRVHSDIYRTNPKIPICIGFLFLLAGISMFPIATSSSYHSSSDFHAAMEIFGSLLGVSAGVIFLVQFYVEGKRFFLFVGMAFLLNGGEDFVHGLFAFGFFEKFLGLDPANAESYIPATYVAGRLIFGFFLLAATFISGRLSNTNNASKELRLVLLIAIPVTMLLTALAYTMNISVLRQPEYMISRPIDFVSSIIFALCILLYTIEAKKTLNPMMGWILISVCINTVGQLYMSFSKEHFDLFFDLGHVFKIAGYLVPLLMLAVNHVKIIHRMDVLVDQLAASNFTMDTRLQAIGVHDIVSQTDSDGRILSVNKAFVEISGYSESELIGQDHRILTSGFHKGAFFLDLWKTISSGSVWKGLICNRSKDGNRYWLQSTIVPTTNETGKVTGYFSMYTDVTHFKNMQIDLQGKNEELERFVSIASHDLKSPLVTIQGYIGFLKKDIEQSRYDRIATFSEHIEGGAISMLSVINDLLEISRIGRNVGEKVYVNTRSLAEEIVYNLATQISDANALVIIEDNIPDLHCEKIRIQQVMQNMISNALKYGQCAEHQLQIVIGGSVVCDVVRLFVSDNGPGIDEQYREKVFDMFHRLSTDKDGTGLGLAIVRRVAQIYGGRTWVETTHGGGATFVIALPHLSGDPEFSQDQSAA